MDIEQAIIDIKHFSQTHVDWAEHFEKNPEIEKEYLKTGEWSSAIQHREIVEKYDNVLKILESAKGVKRFPGHLSQAYEIAGNLRDEFTDIGENEERLKDHCNTIRGKIYELRELRSNFSRLINQIEE